MRAALLLACAALQDADFDLPPGFAIERAAAERHGYLALCAAGPGRLILSTEGQGLQLARDADGDGWFEALTPLGGGLGAAQGLALVDEVLYVVGRRGEESALWRARLVDETLIDVVPLLALDDDDEHGAHGVVAGPDGRLYLSIGDAGRPATPARNAAAFSEPATAGLPPLPDPGGFGRDARWPYGHVAAVDPASGEWELFAAGLRNAYDLVFVGGTLVTVDSDMEWDVGLPWYRPVRALRLERGQDHGARPGSGVRLDSPPALLELGRGSPTGLARVGRDWPERWRGALLVGDWSNARVTAIHAEGARAGSEPLVRARGAWNVTDLAFGADGALYLVSGGRGTPGDLLRLRWVGGVEEPALFDDWSAPPARAPLVARGLDDLLARLEDGAAEPVERLRAADRLRGVDEGWDRARALRALDFFERAATFAGGGNLQGYVQLMLEGVLERVPVEVTRSLAEEGRLGPRALATLLARSPDAGALLAPLQAAFAALDGAGDAALAQGRKRALLASLTGAAAPGLDDWLRAVHDREPRLRGEVLALLARRPAPEDFERHVAGLAHGQWEVRQASARALVALERRAADAPTLRAVLDGARRHGARGGRRLLEVAAHWSGRAVGPPDPRRWPDELADWERWFRATYPDWIPPERGPGDGPAWDLEATATFLERSAARPGSAARGAEVFRAATCDRCHTLGRLGSGWAPDLTGVTRRFERRALLDALVNPSAVVAERYATSEVTTHDGERFDGRLVRESEDSLELLLSNGTRVRLARDELASRTPSPVSAMPEGLLAPLTLEEIKDLLAFLGADGAPAGDAAREAGWLRLFDDAQRPRWGGSFAGWRLADGVLAGRTEGQDGNTYIEFRGAPDDFELEVDVHCASGNSGVQYRSRVVEGRPDPVGYQADVGQAFWGSIYATDGRGLVAGPEPAARDRALVPDGWNHLHLRVEGDRHVVELNGVPMVDVRDGAHGSGVLALQLHGGPDMRVWYANLRLRALR